MRVFLNAATPTAADLDAIARLGFAGVRVDVPSADVVPGLVAAFDSVPTLVPLFIVDYTAPNVAELAQLVARQASTALHEYAVELGNELNIPGRGHPAVAARAYGLAFAGIECACRVIDPGVQLVTAGVFGLSQASIEWVRQVAAIVSPLAIVGFHPYREKNSDGPWTPWSGYRSRAGEFAALWNAAGGRRLWATEVGWHTAPERSGWWIFSKTSQLSDSQVLLNLRAEAGLNAQAGAEVTTVYQLNDGPTNTGIDRYGIRNAAGAFKPQAQIGRWS